MDPLEHLYVILINIHEHECQQQNQPFFTQSTIKHPKLAEIFWLMQICVYCSFHSPLSVFLEGGGLQVTSTEPIIYIFFYLINRQTIIILTLGNFVKYQFIDWQKNPRHLISCFYLEISFLIFESLFLQKYCLVNDHNKTPRFDIL